jgi:hypothetical protein
MDASKSYCCWQRGVIAQIDRRALIDGKEDGAP